MSPISKYCVANGAFLAVLAVGAAIGSISAASPIYLILLFAISSSPLISLRKLNDRYAILALFSAFYFVLFGLLDVIRLYTAAASAQAAALLSPAEVVILAGAVFAHFGYRIACRKDFAGRRRFVRDLPERTLVVGGLLLWFVSTWMTWMLRVDVLTGPVGGEGLERLSPLLTFALLLANMLRPLAIVMLAYAHFRYRRPYMLPVLIAVIAFQVVFGFVVDVKGDTMLGFVLVVVTKVMMDGRIPKNWMVASVVLLALAFPAMQANRMLRNQYNLDKTDVAANLVEVAKMAFARGEDVTTGRARAQSIFERMTLKGSVDMIVRRTGADVAYQGGHTLIPLYGAFIPRIIWPGKPDVQTGQLVNQEFDVSDPEFSATYISPSHLGELYWNFGWPGIVLGMTAIGTLLGLIGRYVDMSRGATITQVLVAAATIELIILGFEGTIAARYVTWMRSIAVIALLHVAFARVPRRNRVAARVDTPGAGSGRVAASR